MGSVVARSLTGFSCGASSGCARLAGGGNSDASCSEKLNVRPIAEEVCLTNWSTPRVLFIGDSHAMALYSSIHAGKIALPSILVSGHSCEFYPALEYTPTNQRAWGNNCVALARKAVALATGLSSITTVIGANITPPLSSTRMSPFRSGGILLAEREAFVRGTGELVEQMAKAGKKVLDVKDVPYFSQTAQDCRKRIAYVTPSVCRIDRSEFDRSRDDYNNAVGDIARRHPSLEVVDPTALFCDSAHCRNQDDEAFLYADRHHLSVYGSASLFEAFLGARLDPGLR